MTHAVVSAVYSQPPVVLLDDDLSGMDDHIIYFVPTELPRFDSF